MDTPGFLFFLAVLFTPLLTICQAPDMQAVMVSPLPIIAPGCLGVSSEMCDMSLSHQRLTEMLIRNDFLGHDSKVNSISFANGANVICFIFVIF